jgi:hypothetical protein
MSDYLAKPFTQAELLAVVTRAAETHTRTSNNAGAIVDTATIGKLATDLGVEAVERLLHSLALRIEMMLRKLEDPTVTDSLGDLAHELAGSGGTLGFAGLAATACRFEAGTADAAEMRHAAVAALSELQRRRTVEPAIVD